MLIELNQLIVRADLAIEIDITSRTRFNNYQSLI
jgi:hypothetical protein